MEQFNLTFQTNRTFVVVYYSAMVLWTSVSGISSWKIACIKRFMAWYDFICYFYDVALVFKSGPLHRSGGKRKTAAQEFPENFHSDLQ